MMKCPCCSTKRFADCCEPIINGHVKALSPEQLMRARFSAYASQNAHYIFNTYAIESRDGLTLGDLKQEMDNAIWTKLTIEHHSLFKTNTPTTDLNTYPTVSFSAYYLIENNLFKMSEKSRFVYTNQWFYLDGTNIKHNDLGRIKSNDVCPCFKNSLEGGLTNAKKVKKFKHCCAR